MSCVPKQLPKASWHRFKKVRGWAERQSDGSLKLIEVFEDPKTHLRVKRTRTI